MSANGPAGQEAILAILEKLPASVVISDFDTGEILWTNAWNIEIASASHPDELIGRSLLEFVTPEDLGRALEAIETTRKGGNPGPLTCRIRRLDGTRADAQISSVTIRFDGRTAMLSLLSDVTAVEQAMRDLAESEERYRMLVETSPDGIAVCVDNDIAYVNPTLAEALGCKSGEELVGKSMFDFIDPADHRGVRDAKKHLFLTKRPHPTAPITLLRKDGGRLLSAAQTTLVRWRGMQATQTLLRDIASSMEPPQARSSDPHHIVALNTTVRHQDMHIVHELTDTQSMDARIPTSGERASESRERVGADTLHELVLLALDSAFDSVIVHRPNGELLFANRAAAAELGMTPQELLEAGPWAWSTAPPNAIIKKLEAIKQNGTQTHLGERTLPDGSARAAEIHSTWVDTDNGPIIVSVARDATERLEAEDALHRLAFYDALTGLANRSMLDDRLKLAISSARRHGDLLGVLFVDIDDFKPINDTHGHDAGDVALKVIAKRMCNSVRTEDTVARVGGDEFVVVLPRLSDEADLETAANKLVQAIRQPIELTGDVRCCVSASVGYALFDPDHDDAHSLVIRADLAMYHARQSGRPVSAAVPLG